MPLDYLLSVLRDESKPEETRIDVAKAAAPYVHARLTSVDANVKADVSGGFAWLPPQ